jgi:hypothetical protein
VNTRNEPSLSTSHSRAAATGVGIVGDRQVEPALRSGFFTDAAVRTQPRLASLLFMRNCGVQARFLLKKPRDRPYSPLASGGLCDEYEIAHG